MAPLLNKRLVRLARRLGAVMRLGALYSGRSADFLATSKLGLTVDSLALTVQPGQQAMISNAVERRLASAADLWALRPEVIEAV